MPTVSLHNGDCVEWLATLPAASVDAVITDPPYPEIDRPYGRWTEAEWWDLMMNVCREVRRVLKPTGSAVFILQPNSRKVGSMRGWLWRFMAWACDEWNMVQDAWWWNTCALPVGGAITAGLMRGSVKACVWCGPTDAYRNQSAVLWAESVGNQVDRLANRATNQATGPSGRSVNYKRIRLAAVERGGVTPFNLLPLAGADRWESGARAGHSAATPDDLADWWTRYICPPGGVVCDPFAGSGTMGIAAIKLGRQFVGCERMPEYHAIATRRIEAEQARHPLFQSAEV